MHRERIVGRASCRSDVPERRTHPGELAEGHAQLVDHLRAVRAEPAAARGVVRPPRGDFRGRVGEHRHDHHDGGEAGLADRTRPDRPRQRRLSGVPAELGSEHVHDARRLGRGEHAPRLGRVAGERLLADDVLARRDRGQRELGVGVRRGRDRDRVDPVERERVVDRRQRERHLEERGTFAGPVRIPADERAHVDARGAQRAHVRDAAEARPDDDRAERPRLAHRPQVPRGVIPAAT